jgi:hypothetical protein
MVRVDVVHRVTAPDELNAVPRCATTAGEIARAMGTRSATSVAAWRPWNRHRTLINFSTQPGNVALDGAAATRLPARSSKHIAASNDDLSAILMPYATM